METKIKYPRRVLLRGFLRLLGRGLITLLTRAQITGKENFPRKGPVILVGNHTAAMEVVMMAVYSPQSAEFMGSVDLPHDNGLMVAIMNLYGMIPVFRGNVTPSSLKMGVEVLNQGGTLGLFPEGGIWEPSIRRAQSGVAWLSYHAKAPVLPIGYGEMRGKLKDIFAFKRPIMKMNVGKLIPPVRKPDGKSRKQHFQDEANRIMDAVWELIPEEDRVEEVSIQNERFELLVEATSPDGAPVAVPEALHPKNGAAFSKFTHRTTLIKNFILNLKMSDVEALMRLVDRPSLENILKATTSIIEYLETDNPYYFTYRYEPREGRAMEAGIREVGALARWAKDDNLNLKFTPLRRFTVTATGQEVVQDRTQETEKW